MNLKKRKYVIAATGMIVAYNYMSKRKTRSKWVKNWLLRREEFSHMALLRELAENEPNDLKNYLRMSKSDFDNLLSKLIQFYLCVTYRQMRYKYIINEIFDL